MERYYVIEYKPNKFTEILSPEFIITFIVIQIGTIIFTLVNNMFVEDLIGALTFILFPVAIFSIALFVMFLFSRYKLIFNYKNMTFIKQSILIKRIYNLNELKIERKYIERIADYSNSSKIVITINEKIICKIDVKSFEEVTGYNVDTIIS